VTERLITFAFALGALALFVVLFVQPERGLDRGRDVPRPTTEETRGNGYHAAYAWLRASDVRAESLRERFGALVGQRDLAPHGNVLIVTLPGTAAFWRSETGPLQNWLRDGNTLLVIAALLDEPDWATALGGVNVGDLKVLCGLDFNSVADRAGRASAALSFVRNAPHAYFTGVEEAVAAAAPARHDWLVSVPYDSFMFALARERASGQAVLWTRVLGDGRIVVLGAGSLFTDRALGLAGNARLFANIIGVNLGPRGAVIFDDFHQGLSRAYDPHNFYSDPRLYATGAILIALWFVWVLGATRLRIRVTRIPAPREADLVRASGDFLARVLSADVAARRLFEHFFRRVHRRTASAASPAGAWEFLQASTHVSASDLAQVRRWHTQAFAGERVPLVRLYNLILRIDRQIA
jgi:hypothetical protein